MFFKSIFDFVKKVEDSLEINNSLLLSLNDYFYKIIDNYKYFARIESSLEEKIESIKKSFESSQDILNITDYQNTIWITYGLIYLRQIDLIELENKENYEFVKLIFEECVESVVAEIRSFKLLEDERILAYDDEDLINNNESPPNLFNMIP